MGYLAQDINQPLTQRVAMINRGGGLVASPFTGAVNTAVLLFAALATRQGPPSYVLENNDANAGTTLVLRKPGVYAVKLSMQIDEPIDLVFGISQDVAAAGFTGVPSFAIAGFTDVQRATTAVALPAQEIETTIEVQPEQEGSGVFGGSIVRFHAQLAAGGAPAAGIIQASAYYSVERINQLHS